MSRAARDPIVSEDKATALFACLDIALVRGDYTAASKAQQALADLGWDVRHRRYQATAVSTASPQGGRL